MSMPIIRLGVLFLVSVSAAQTPPALHQRSEAPQQSQTHAAKGLSSLPDEASGEYELDDHGSVVQITIEQNRLSGYVTKMDERIPLTLFFDTTAIDANRLSFSTKTVHGMRYSFAGKIVRGNAESPSQTGFYRLVGDWTTYLNGGQEISTAVRKPNG